MTTTVNHTTERGSRLEGGAIRRFDQPRTHILANEGATTVSVTLGEPHPFVAGTLSQEVYGYLQRCRLRVLQAYSGAGSPRLIVRVNDGTQLVTVIQWDPKLTGYVECRADGVSASPAALAASPVDPSRKCKLLEVRYLNFTGSLAEMPRLTVDADFAPIFG